MATSDHGRRGTSIPVWSIRCKSRWYFSVFSLFSLALFQPFNYEYQWNDTAGNYNIPNTTATSFNGYLGSVYQQAVSGVTDVDQDCYQLEAGCYSVYAVEYEPGFDDAVSTVGLKTDDMEF